MKKKKKEHSKKFYLIRGSILLILGIVSLILLISYSSKNENPFSSSSKMTDAMKFKQEYESLNNMVNAKGKNEYIKVNIDDKNPVIYKTGKQIIDILENGSGVIFLGYNKSNWSRNIVEPLIDSINNSSLSELYYLDIYDIRDEISKNNNGKLTIKKSGTQDYQKTLEILDEHLGYYDDEDNSIKYINIPTIVFVKDGNIIDFHEGTLETHANANDKLNENEYNELKEILSNAINKIIDNNNDN